MQQDKADGYTGAVVVTYVAAKQWSELVLCSGDCTSQRLFSLVEARSFESVSPTALRLGGCYWPNRY